MRVGVSTDKLEEFLEAIGCRKGSCPTPRFCVWYDPAGEPFEAPNPERILFIPAHEMPRIGQRIHEIMSGPYYANAPRSGP